MKIAVVGSGYVGLVTGACLAEMGNSVMMLDNDSRKIEALKQGIVPIFEPGLSNLILKNAKNIDFTNDARAAFKGAQIIFIAHADERRWRRGFECRFCRRTRDCSTY